MTYDEDQPSGPQIATLFEYRIRTEVICRNDTAKENHNSKGLISLLTRYKVWVDTGTCRGQCGDTERKLPKTQEGRPEAGYFLTDLRGTSFLAEWFFWISQPQTPRQQIWTGPTWSPVLYCSSSRKLTCLAKVHACSFG